MQIYFLSSGYYSSLYFIVPSLLLPYAFIYWKAVLCVMNISPGSERSGSRPPKIYKETKIFLLTLDFSVWHCQITPPFLLNRKDNNLNIHCSYCNAKQCQIWTDIKSQIQ